MSPSTQAAHTAHYYRDPPTLTDANGSRHWMTRGANFVVVATQAAPGTDLDRAAAQQEDEYILLLPADTRARVVASGEVVSSPGDSVTIVPPGSSRISLPDGGWAYRVFSKHARDLAALATNKDQYAHAGKAAELVTWPEPVGGYKLRHYDLARYVRSDTTMRLFRTRHLMVNVFLPSKAPRDVTKMTPHSHADFEQGSLALHGAYVHYMRYPWGPNLLEWREDERIVASAPSLCIIPPTVIHTSQAVGESGMRLVDIFAPPREDFSAKPGLVCNADDYPPPAPVEAKLQAAIAAIAAAQKA